jgi:alpha-L-fucosidase
LFGEGPAITEAAKLAAQNFNEGKGRPLGASDLRFTMKGDTVYAVVFGWPENGIVKIRSFSDGNELWPRAVNRVELLGGGNLHFQRNGEALEVSLPPQRPAITYAMALKIS